MRTVGASILNSIQLMEWTLGLAACMTATIALIVLTIRLKKQDGIYIQDLANTLMFLPFGVIIFKKEKNKPIFRNKKNQLFAVRNKSEKLTIHELDYNFEFDGQPYTMTLQYDNSDLEVSRYRATRSARLKNQFITNTTQDLKKPLNAIVGYVELLKDDYPKEDMEEYLHVVQENSDILLELIDEMIVLSQLQADVSKNRQVHCFKVTELVEYAQCEMNRLQDIYSDKKLDCSLLAEVEGLSHWGDISRLKKVMGAMLVHSFKRTQKGTVDVSFKYDENTQMVVITFEDTSPSLSDEDIAHLFETQSNHEFKLNSSFVFSLHIAHLILQHAGGCLGVKKRPNGGVCINMCLNMSQEAK